MKAIILAAGYGNRMKPLTDETHKTLLTVGGSTIIGRICDGLVANGVLDVAIVTGYRAEELQSYMRANYPHLHLEFVHNARYRETNNIFSMSLAFEKVAIDDDIILIESDLIYEPAVIRRVIQSPRPNVALVDRYRSGMDGTVVTVADGVIRNIIPPHLQTANFDFSDKYKTLNIYKFSKEFCNTVFKQLLTYYATVIDANCYYELILGILIYMQRETIHAEVLDGERWAEVDDPNDLRVAEFVFTPDTRASILDRTSGGYWSHDVLDFCFIRNMYFPNASMLGEMRTNLANLLHNYGSRQDVLNQKMAYHLLCDHKRVVALNGASQVFPILKDFVGGKRVLIPEPTFGEYSRMFPDAAVYNDDVGYDLKDLAERAKAADVIVFVNPNNPTGTTHSSQSLYEFAVARPDKTIVVDESFIDFSGFPSMVSLLEEKPLDNVICVKSLSKTLGVPGMRLGYVYTANAAFLRYLGDRVPIWNLNSVAEYMLEIILKHRGSLTSSYVNTSKDRARLIGALNDLPRVKKAFPSGGNFVMFELEASAPSVETVVRRMLALDSIYVKDVSSKFQARPRLRVAVRLPEENARLVNALSIALSDEAGSLIDSRLVETKERV
jgi:histidinol-phosphate/aromatic aminotransferase/cobyric acid decarboxylase-like protein/choline kinase